MKKALRLLPVLAISLTLGASQAFAATYPGNGSLDFGGPVGTGSLTLTDDGTTVSGTLNKGSGTLDNVLVIYIDSVPGGFTSTTTFSDAADGLRRAISGFDGGTNRSLMTFMSGFEPDYAIALGPQSDNFGGLWGLASGGNNSLNFVSAIGLTPTGGGSGSSSSFTFSFPVTGIGLVANSGSPFSLFGTYISNSGYRSLEAGPGNDTGTQGWLPFTQTASVIYGTVPVEISEFSID